MGTREVYSLMEEAPESPAHRWLSWRSSGWLGGARRAFRPLSFVPWAGLRPCAFSPLMAQHSPPPTGWVMSKLRVLATSTFVVMTTTIAVRMGARLCQKFEGTARISARRPMAKGPNRRDARLGDHAASLPPRLHHYQDSRPPGLARHTRRSASLCERRSYGCSNSPCSCSRLAATVYPRDGSSPLTSANRSCLSPSWLARLAP